LSFSFSMIPPPPSSTLFPYTTLFRSHRWEMSAREVLGLGAIFPALGWRLPRVLRGLSLIEKQHARAPHFYLPTLGTDPSRQGEGDRKSTRLNSSHLVISYAVFCLKKK